MFAKKGFTLLEILLAVGAISILAGIVIVAINPGKQLATARNTTRLVDVHTIADAIYQYTLDHDGVMPAVFSSSTYTMLGTSGSGCAATCGGEPIDYSSWNSSQNFGDQGAGSFNAGTLNNVIYDNTNLGLKLAGGTSGDFTSRALDSGTATTNWLTFSWTPQFPTDKELPGNSRSETGYPVGNADMTGNLLLLHLNEATGATTFKDDSGANKNAACGGTVCPVASEIGKLNTAAHFDGLNDFIRVTDVSTLKYTGGNMSISLWVKPDTNENGGLIISRPWNGGGKYNYEISYTKRSDGSLIGFCVGADSLICVSSPLRLMEGVWTHILAIASPSTLKIYLNGMESSSLSNTITNWTVTGRGDENQALSIGTLFPYAYSWSGRDDFSFSGSLDEIAFFSRTLSATDALNMYKRGAARLKLQTRVCADMTCAGQNFVGPDGTANTFYSELSNATLSPPSFSLGNLPANKYFQYKAFFESDNTAASPILQTVNVGANVPPPAANAAGSDTTADACLDIVSILAGGGYITNLPFDPKQGSAANTYYAVKAADHGKVMVKSCRAELGQDISTVR